MVFVSEALRLPALAALAIAAVPALAGGGCGDDESTTTSSTTSPSTTADRPPERPSPGGPGTGDGRGEDRGDDNAAGPSKPSVPAAERAAARAVRAYVGALDDRDGERVCALLVPGALDELELPRERGGCAASLDASIGYRDPRGLPAFDDARVLDIASVDVNGKEARVTASVVTQFADRDEPSIEDDIVYLERSPGGRWLIAKPSSALYRAIGVADIPPEVISPP